MGSGPIVPEDKSSVVFSVETYITTGFEENGYWIICRLCDRERWQRELIETWFWTVCWVSYEGSNFESYGNTLMISLCRWKFGLWSTDENCGCELAVQTRNYCLKIWLKFPQRSAEGKLEGPTFRNLLPVFYPLGLLCPKMWPDMEVSDDFVSSSLLTFILDIFVHNPNFAKYQLF